jgi:6-phosphofructokinase 1
MYGQGAVAFVPSVKGASPPAKKAKQNGTAYGSPLCIGVVLSGGQAPGGHNVIAGLYDYVVKQMGGTLHGFRNGPRGIFDGDSVELDDATIDAFRNTGGFDMIASGRDKIHSPEQFAACVAYCTKLGLQGVVVIGGDDSNTNACMLAEHFAACGSKIQCIGCPKTIDNDLKNASVPVSFGFDTASKVYAEMIGNVALDALSTRKKYHWIRVMGRSASHIALECALQTQPNICLIGEEVEALGLTLAQVTQQIVDTVVARYAAGKDFGVALVPEGLIEFIPEIGALISEINDIIPALAEEGNSAPQPDDVTPRLSAPSAKVFTYLPASIAQQLLLDRDSHGNVMVSAIETEKLLCECVETELAARADYNGKFTCQFHYFGYEGRSAHPSKFDCDYCYALGFNAGLLLARGCSGLISSVGNLSAPPSEWTAGGTPLTALMNMERRSGHDKPVIRKALTELDGKPFAVLAANRARWAADDCYRTPGPIQFSGAGSGDITLTLLYELEQRAAIAAGMSKADAAAAPPTPISAMLVAGAPIPRTPGQNSAVTVRRRAAGPATVPPLLIGSAAVAVTPGQCIARGAQDTAALKRLFPTTYAKSASVGGFVGPPIVELVAGASGADAGAAVRIGVVFCGRQSPGGHNIISGLFEALHPHGGVSRGELVGFINGTDGLSAGNHIVVTRELVDLYGNMGGYDMLGRSKDKMCAPGQLAAITATCTKLALSGLVCIGGNYTIADTAAVSEYLAANQTGAVRTTAVAVPVTIDGDVTNEFVETTVGFDTASRCCATLVGNMAVDSNSAKKYWLFLRCMGRVGSHITLESALQTRPNAILIGEEIRAQHKTLDQIIGELADLVLQRRAAGKNFGVVMVPEGLLTFIPEVQGLIREIVAGKSKDELSPWHRALLESMPEYIQRQLRREVEGTSGSVQLSAIETERLIASLVEGELIKRGKLGKYKSITHFFGYQARCSFPTLFDASYATTLGMTAVALIRGGCNGYLASCRNLKEDLTRWQPFGVPIVSLLDVDHAENTAFYAPDLVDVSPQGRAFKLLCAHRDVWAMGKCVACQRSASVQVLWR